MKLSKNAKIIILILIEIILVFLLGYYIGSHSVKVEEKKVIEYIQGNPITDNIKPEPKDTTNGSINTIPPEIKEYITKIDTIYIDRIQYITQEIDSGLIVKDWLLRRDYSEVLFDNDSVGKLQIDLYTQYNRISNLSYNFLPRYKREVIVKELQRNYHPFAGVGINTNNEMNAQLGLFYKHLGVGYQFTKSLDNNTAWHGVNIFYKLDF